MNSRIPMVLLCAVGIAPIGITVACGGKVLGTDNVEPESASASARGTLQACPADSTPLPMPASPDPVLLAQCQKSCDRNFKCVGCTYTCNPTA